MDDYSDFRRSPNVEDRTNESPAMGLLRNLLQPYGAYPVGGYEGHLPVPGLNPLAVSLGASDIEKFAAQLQAQRQAKEAAERTAIRSNPDVHGFDERLDPNGPPVRLDRRKDAPPSFYQPVQFASGVPDKIIGAESGGNPNATNPNSSATGAGQFINSTWLDVFKATRPDLAQGKSDQEILALRTDSQLSRQMTEAYAAQNGKILAQAGHETTPGNTYLAHFAGPKGAVSVLSADPTTPVASILTPEAVKANPFLAKMTAGDLRAWADKKMGGAAPMAAAAQPVQASPAAPPGAPLQIAPQAPIFPQAAPQQQAQPQQAQAEPFQMPQQGQPPPIFYPQRRSPDLSKLHAALKAPIFSRRG